MSHRSLPVQRPPCFTRLPPPIPLPSFPPLHDATCALMAMQCMQFPCVRYVRCSCQSCACMYACLACLSLAGTLTRSCGDCLAMHPSVYANCTCSCFKWISVHIVRGLQGYTVAHQQHQNSVYYRTSAVHLLPLALLSAQLPQTQPLKLTPQLSTSPPTSPPNSALLHLLPQQPHRQTHRQTKKRKRQKRLI